MNTKTLIDRVWIADEPATRALRAVLLALVGSALLTVSAKVQIPFWPVPLTMQTFVVMVLGLGYGFRLGAATVALYLAQGALGLPVLRGRRQHRLLRRPDRRLPPGLPRRRRADRLAGRPRLAPQRAARHRRRVRRRRRRVRPRLGLAGGAHRPGGRVQQRRAAVPARRRAQDRRRRLAVPPASAAPASACGADRARCRRAAAGSVPHPRAAALKAVRSSPILRKPASDGSRQAARDRARCRPLAPLRPARVADTRHRPGVCRRGIARA
ncbi:MAG: biotin transporter BioY [Halofilum sp. (in: g-proteobacteria)]|nr:biotin transporter BioY [Halofilum sp. (in: g-proteobacteria)]